MCALLTGVQTFALPISARSTRATSWPAARARSAASTWRFDSMASDRYPADLIARRTRARATSAPRPRNDMPRPEDVFLAWLCSLPEGADIAAAARREVARIERRAPLRPELQRLRDLFLEIGRAHV